MDIVILHGWNLSAKNYSKLILYLTQKGYRVFCPDFPGFGSAKTPDKACGVDDYVSFVKNYTDKNKIKRFILIGHSFGGRVAIRFAELYPAKIDRLILTGVPGLLPVSRSKINTFLILAKIGRLLFSLSLISTFKERARKLLYKIAGSSDYYQAQGVMRETFLKIIRTDLEKCLKKINCQTLLVWGEKDVITPIWIGYKIKNIIPNAKLSVAKNEGHGFVHKNPKLFIKLANL